MGKEHRYTNRLIHESSPYLQQHAHNPVDWFPWGREAFDLANEENKPIFLSIGYSTCHWCHVMEREVFEDEEIAGLMNRTFVNVKVDREELPQVDSLYMEFAQSMMAGAAGWPLNMILTPDLKPFYAATYMPASTKQGIIGMRELVPQMEVLWNSEERHRVLEQAGQIVEAFAIHEEADLPGEIPPREVGEAAGEILFKLADPVYGGLAGAPKFPIGYQVGFFLRYLRCFRDSRALFCAERSLEMISRGGIHDHIGGGFARYSVDEAWIVPHFEKMLYDQALLADAYLEAWQLTNRDNYREVSRGVLDYLLRDMRHPDGGFFSAEDADSEGREGLFYTWTQDEVKEILGEDRAALFCEYYNITPQGNFEGRSIPHITLSMEEFAGAKQISLGELQARLLADRADLFEVRQKRSRPAKDDKVVCGWNGLVIHVLARAGLAFDHIDYLDQARNTADFLKKSLWEQGRLYRRWREGERAFSACLEDYAYLIRGLLTLFECSGETRWLAWAIELAGILERDFRSSEAAYYVADGEDEHILLRQTRFADGAEPSGNAVHSENLIRLYQLTGNQSYLDQAEAVIATVRSRMESYPPGYIYHLIALQRFYDGEAPTVIVALNTKAEHKEQLKALLFHPFMPNTSVIWRSTDDEQLFDLVPATRTQGPLEDKTTLYVCRRGVCQEPQTQLSEMIAAIHLL